MLVEEIDAISEVIEYSRGSKKLIIATTAKRLQRQIFLKMDRNMTKITYNN